MCGKKQEEMIVKRKNWEEVSRSLIRDVDFPRDNPATGGNTSLRTWIRVYAVGYRHKTKNWKISVRKEVVKQTAYSDEIKKTRRRV